MEFGNAPQPEGSPDIDAATRLAASTRQRTLTPAHEYVAPEDVSDDQVAAQHVLQPAVANVQIDTEFTTGDESANIAVDKPHHIALTIIISVSLLLAAVLAYGYMIFS